MKKPRLEPDSVETGEMRIVVGISADGETTWNFTTEGLSMSEAVYTLEKIKHDMLHQTESGNR